MKITCKRENLARALSITSRLVGSASTLPVLANILLTTDKNRLKLSSTNLELGANCWVGAKVVEEGAITVPARLLTDFINNLNEDTIELETDNHNLKMTTNQHHSLFNGIDVEEFPSIPQVKGKIKISLPASEFKAALSQVILVAATDDTRPILSGVYLYSRGKQLVVVATDSYRLAEKTLSLKQHPTSKLNVIIPARTLQEVVRALGDETDLELVIDEGQVLFRFGSTEIISRQLEGQFPNYQELIPKTATSTIRIGVDQFSQLAKVASLFAQGNAGSVAIRVNSDAQTLVLKSVASQVGEDTSETKVKVTGTDAEVTLNSRYISEGLGVMEASEVDFAITGKINPCIMRPVGITDYFHLIMPLRS